MSAEKIASALVAALEQHGVDYMVVGSFSSNLYGIPRSTKDLDVVVEWGSHSVREIANSLGPDFRLDPQSSFEMVTLTVRHIIEVRSENFKIELFQLSDDAHDIERFRRRQRAIFHGTTANVATPEDVIVMKLKWSLRQGRGRDRDDVRNVIAVQGDKLDFDYIHSWCAQHGTRPLLDEIRAGIPTII